MEEYVSISHIDRKKAIGSGLRKGNSEAKGSRNYHHWDEPAPPLFFLATQSSISERVKFLRVVVYV